MLKITRKIAKRKRNKLKVVGLVLLLAALLTGSFYAWRYWSGAEERQLAREVAALPSPEGLQISSTAGEQSPEKESPAAEESAVSIPETVNYDVPFTPQAPHANWDYTHEEACEEAAILMAKRFFFGQEISGPDDAEEGIQDIIFWEKEHLGFFESTTAEESARVIREMFGLKTEIILNPSVEQIKRALAEGRLVIVPCAGRQIGNPFYKSPGPLYHFLLLKGYTKEQFITNDAGTRRGANYPYKFKTVLEANHDWNGGQVDSGEKKIILVSK